MAEAIGGTGITAGAAGGITARAVGGGAYNPMATATRVRGIGGKPRCC